MNKDLVLVETYKGIKIFLNKGTERYQFDFNGELEEMQSLWNTKQFINEKQKKIVNKEYFIVGGYFNQEIQKILMLEENKALDRQKYKILATTEGSNYDLGRTIDEHYPKKLYEVNKENQALFDEVAKLYSQIVSIEEKQEELVNKLKRKGVKENGS